MTSLHVDTGLEWRGGQAQVLQLVRGLVARGDRAVLVAPPASALTARAMSSGIGVACVPLRGEWDLGSVAQLVGIIGRYRPQVVHAHTAHAVTLAGVAARIAGVPLVVAARRVDFPVSRVGRLKLQYLADVVVCVSAAIRAVLRGCGVSDQRLEVVHSGVLVPSSGPPADEVARVRTEFAAIGTPLVGAIGALVDHKDHATLIEAATLIHAQRPNVRFVIVGAGPLEPSLRALAQQRGLAGVVHFAGFRADVAAVLRGFDVFVLSSHLEGLGSSVLDAMAAEVPVVATRTGGVPEMVATERTGLLVEPKSPPQLAAAIVRLLDDDGLQEKLSRAALTAVRDRFSIDRTVAATAELYRRRLSDSAQQPTLY